jgi:hypothetical protein
MAEPERYIFYLSSNHLVRSSSGYFNSPFYNKHPKVRLSFFTFSKVLRRYPRALSLASPFTLSLQKRETRTFCPLKITYKKGIFIALLIHRAYPTNSSDCGSLRSHNLTLFVRHLQFVYFVSVALPVLCKQHPPILLHPSQEHNS